MNIIQKIKEALGLVRIGPPPGGWHGERDEIAKKEKEDLAEMLDEMKRKHPGLFGED